MKLSTLIPGLKTYITAALAILGAVTAFLNDIVTALPAIEVSLTALLAVFIRSGMKSEIAKLSK